MGETNVVTGVEPPTDAAKRREESFLVNEAEMLLFYLACNNENSEKNNANFRSVSLIFIRRTMEPGGREGWKKGEREGGGMSRPRKREKEGRSLNEETFRLCPAGPQRREL